MVNRVAAAVDGSPASMAAVQYAAQLVAPEGTLMLVDVQDVMSFYHDCLDDSITGDVSCDVAYFMKAWNEQARAAKKEAMAIASAKKAHIEWRVVKLPVGHGKPAEAFYRAVSKADMQILVTGKHRGSQLLEGLFGSFPRWLLSHSQIPVVVVPPPEKEAGQKPG